MKITLGTLTRRLSRGHLAAVAVALLTVAAAGAVVYFAQSWWRGEGGRYAPRALLATARITPASSLFGDVLTARAQVLVDPRRIDPATVQLDPDFRPYRIRSSARRVQKGIGGAAVVEFRYAIQCIAQPCVALAASAKSRSADTEAVQLEPAALTARAVAGRALTRKIEWTPFVVRSRLSTEEIALSTPRLPPFTAPKVSWRVAPDTIAALALSLAVLLVLGAGGLVASIVKGDTRRLRAPRIPGHLTPVARALALAEHAAANGELDDGRKALERLSIELGRAGDRDLAFDAARLAWSVDEPSTEAIGGLAEEVRSTHGH